MALGMELGMDKAWEPVVPRTEPRMALLEIGPAKWLNWQLKLELGANYVNKSRNGIYIDCRENANESEQNNRDGFHFLAGVYSQMELPNALLQVRRRIDNIYLSLVTLDPIIIKFDLSD